MLGPVVPDSYPSVDIVNISSMPPSIDLVISRPTLLDLQHNQIYEWKPWKETPHELPWISFSRNTALLNSINHNLFGESSRPRMASSDSKFLLQSSSSQLGFGSSAIDKLAVSFSSLMPESREGENLASQVSGQNPG